MYNQKVMDHFENPRNVGEMKGADGSGRVRNPSCGDVASFQIKVGKNERGEEIIKEVRFKTFGCVAMVASSSAITELIKGKTFKKVSRVGKKELIEALEGMPFVKVHCCLIAIDGLAEAIYDYLTKKGRKIPAELGKGHERVEKYREILREKFGL
jgi:nitrogen fixation NifU-like protein